VESRSGDVANLFTDGGDDEAANRMWAMSQIESSPWMSR
jgi:hypothetical protein